MAAAPKARVVVLGAGWWTQGWHLPHLHRHPDAEIIAVIDPCATPRSAISTLVPLALPASGASAACSRKRKRGEASQRHTWLARLFTVGTAGA